MSEQRIIKINRELLNSSSVGVKSPKKIREKANKSVGGIMGVPTTAGLRKHIMEKQQKAIMSMTQKKPKRLAEPPTSSVDSSIQLLANLGNKQTNAIASNVATDLGITTAQSFEKKGGAMAHGIVRSKKTNAVIPVRKTPRTTPHLPPSVYPLQTSSAPNSQKQPHPLLFSNNPQQPLSQQPQQPLFQQSQQPLFQQPQQPLFQQPQQPLFQQSQQPLSQQPLSQQPLSQQPQQPLIQQPLQMAPHQHMLPSYQTIPYQSNPQLPPSSPIAQLPTYDNLSTSIEALSSSDVDTLNVAAAVEASVASTQFGVKTQYQANDVPSLDELLMLEKESDPMIVLPPFVDSELSVATSAPVAIMADPAYGVLKKGNKPTYREYMRTQKNASLEVGDDDIIRPSAVLRSQKKSNKDTGFFNRLVQEIDNGADSTIVKVPLKAPPSIVRKYALPLESIVSATSDSIPTGENETLIKQNGSLFSETEKGFQQSGVDLNDETEHQANTSLLLKKEPERKMYTIRKKIMRKFEVGKNKTKKVVSVLIPDAAKRLKVMNMFNDTQTNLPEMKQYLSRHGMLTVGSDAPVELVEALYENAKLAGGEIFVKETETLEDKRYN